MRLSCDGDFEEDEVENPVFSTADTVDMEAKLCNSGVHSTGNRFRGPVSNPVLNFLL